MKKFISLLLTSVMAISLFASCSGKEADVTTTNPTTTEATTKDMTKQTLSIASRITSENLNITYDSELLEVSNDFVSEVHFVVKDESSEMNGKSFGLTFISDISSQDDYNASMGDASVVIKLSALEKKAIGDGHLVYCYDESWYGEFKTRYFLYELNGDLIKITINEQISNESLEFIFNVLEFNI